MDLWSLVSLLAITGGCSIRSRIVAVPAAGQATWKPQATERADYMLVYRFRGAGIATRITYTLVSPPISGSYEIVDDDYPVALGDVGGELEIRFTNSDPANALNVEVDLAGFTASQLEDLRCIVQGSFPRELVEAG